MITDQLCLGEEKSLPLGLSFFPFSILSFLGPGAGDVAVKVPLTTLPGVRSVIALHLLKSTDVQKRWKESG